MSERVEKSLAYVIRLRNGCKELLVFEHLDHPEAGVQVPAGTVRSSENIEEAVLREIKEEVGLSFNKTNRYLGRFDWPRVDRNEIHVRNVFVVEADEGLPNEWIHTVKSHDQDHDLRFKVYWTPVENAVGSLAVEQDKYLHLLD